MTPLLSCALALLLAGGNGDSPPLDSTLLIVPQSPATAGDPTRLTSLEWATGRERWSLDLILDASTSTGYMQAFGPDLWIHLFSAHQDHGVVVVDLATGRERFRVAGTFLGAPTSEGFTCMLFHQDADGLVAFDPVTGRELWRRRDWVAKTSCSRSMEHRLVFHVGEEYRALDPATGEDRWKFKADPGSDEDDGDLIWFSRPALVGVDSITGQERRRLKTPEGSRFLSISGRKAYFQRADHLEAYRLSDGGLLWSQDLQQTQPLSSMSEHRGILLVYTAGIHGFLTLHPDTGRLHCTVDFPKSDQSCTGAKTGRTLGHWFGHGAKGSYKDLQLFDMISGKLLWQGEAMDQWESDTREELYVSMGKDVTRVNLETGGVLWSTPLTEQPCAQLAGPGCTVVALGNRLVCLKAATGKTLWEKSLPRNPDHGCLVATRAR